MTTTRVSIFLGAAIGLAALAVPATTTIAADLDYGGSIKDSYAPPMAPGRVWYLKGFLGQGNYDVDEISTEYYAVDEFDILSQDFESAPFFGIGFGAQCNRWLRWDLTAEYRGNATFHGLDRNNTFNYTNEYTAVVESWTGLANAYIDIFTWRGITPYVGAGIGVASVNVKGMKDVNIVNQSVFSAEDHSEATLAWAIHAGLAYDVTPQVTLELGYRYLNLGDAVSGRATAYDFSGEYSGLEFENIDSHDLMLGMRWKLDQPQAYPVAMK